jgi:hypothetical protein
MSSGERGDRGDRGFNGKNGVDGINGINGVNGIIPSLNDHDLLIRLDEKMDTILKRLEKGDECMKDHETRLSRLESFQATLVGIAGVVAFAASFVWSKFSALFSGGS